MTNGCSRPPATAQRSRTTPSTNVAAETWSPGFGTGDAFADAIEAAEPARTRHLALHEGHLIECTERDLVAVDGAVIEQFGLARTPESWRTALDGYRAAGLTELAYQPAGDDIPGELEAFAQAVGIA